MPPITDTGLCLTDDTRSVTDVDLLARLLGTAEAAHRLLKLSGGLGGLPLLTVEHLRTIPGLDAAGALRLPAALELNRRIAYQALSRPQITSPDDVAALLLPEMSVLDQEQLRVVLLNTKSRMLHIETLYIGTATNATVRIAEVFKPAIRINAPALLVVHNHPSGDPEPSAEDVAMTRQLVEAGRLLEIDVLDRAPCRCV